MSTAFRVGLLVFLALGCLCTGVFLIGNKDFLFARTYRLKADFQDVNGLNNGSDVRIGGIHEGTIREIDLPAQPGGKVTVVMNLLDSTRSLVRTDSRASIKTEGMLGDKFVEISPGSTKGQPVEDNATIAGEDAADFSQQAQALAGQAGQAVEAFRDDADALQHNFLLRGFFEKRGYSDTSELTQHAVSHLPKEKPIKEFEYDPEDIFAGEDNAKLKHKDKLDEPGKFLEGNHFGLAVVASSEAKGDSDKMRLLTEARAKVVRDYLVQNFKINDKRVETIGLGKTKGPDDHSTVAILIYPPAPQTNGNPSPPDSGDQSSSAKP